MGFYRIVTPQHKNGELHGYIFWHDEGQASTFDISGANFPEVAKKTVDDPEPEHNAVLGINNSGVVVGVYQDGRTKKDLGFVARGRDRGRTFTPVDMSTAFPNADVASTKVRGINSNNEIVGTYTDRTGSRRHGFKWQVNSSLALVGTPETLDIFPIPNPFNVGAFPTEATGINDDGVITGTYDAFGRILGFIWKPQGDLHPQGHYQQLEITTQAQRTWANGIANNGTIVGNFRAPSAFDGKSTRHAYIGRPLELIPGLSTGTFIDAIVQWVTAGVMAGGPGWVFPWGGVPWPFPPPNPIMRQAFGRSQNAMLGLVINEMASQITDAEGRRRLRRAALEMVLREVRELMNH